MPRLRYNGLTTTLGASLTSGATSVTFAAALTHSNGTNVPTIVSPDYIPLAILGATGHLSEIVYLTAYTAGATTGTISRGQEGTTGAAHSSGDAVTRAPLVGDGGGDDYFRTGYYSHGTFSNATSTFALTLSRLYARPFLVPVRRSFDRIGANVTVAATAASGGVLRMGIYGPGGGVPGALIVDAGTISSESTGAKALTIAQTLDPGIYWLAVVAQVATCNVTSYDITFETPWVSNSANPGSINAGSHAMNSVTGALGTFTPSGANNQMVAVQLRAA